MFKIGILVVLVIASLTGWRFFDHYADRRQMDRLLALQPENPRVFDASMIADLPEPARRFFTFAIKDGTALRTVAQIEMTGQFSLGDKAQPNYLDMQARQVLAAPNGFIWKMTGRSGHLRLSGSDSDVWTRFWMGGLLPVARAGGTDDHARAAFGRYVAEAVFWSPAAVLPGPNVSWDAVDIDTARMTIRFDGLEQSVDVSVAPDGQPTKIEFQRWSDANEEQTYQLQPFGGFPSAFQLVQGFRVPTHVEAGNFFGTDKYFPFFVVDVTEITFPPRI